MLARAISSTGWILVALTAGAGLAHAQEQLAKGDSADYVLAAPPENTVVEPAAAPETPLTAEESAALDNALTFDPSSFGDGRPKKALRLLGRDDRAMFDISGSQKTDGPSTFVLKPAAPVDFDAKVGADLGLPRDLSGAQAVSPLRTGPETGAAWASVGMPNIGSLDARVDPSNDQGKFGTTFKQSIPVGGDLSLTLQNSFAVTETFSQPTAPQTDLPLMAPPQEAITQGPSQVWSTEKAVKFNIASTGTTLGAGLNNTSTDPVTHNTLSAEQKLLGPLHVTTSVTDVGQTSISKSITAGFKLNW